MKFKELINETAQTWKLGFDLSKSKSLDKITDIWNSWRKKNLDVSDKEVQQAKKGFIDSIVQYLESPSTLK